MPPDRLQVLLGYGVLIGLACSVLLAALNGYFLFVDTHDPARTILTGALGGVLGFYLFGLTLGHGALWLVVLALVGFQGLFVILALYTLLEDALAWW